jgi:hypothetical protein
MFHYASNHPLSTPGLPPTRVLAGHPLRAGRGAAASPPATLSAFSAMRRKAWDATRTDLSRYALPLEERLRRKALLRCPVDTGNHRRTKRHPRRSGGRKKTKPASAAASPGAALGPNLLLRTPTRAAQVAGPPAHPTKTPKSVWAESRGAAAIGAKAKAWVPSGTTAGKGLVERTPGFIDDSWEMYMGVEGEEDTKDAEGMEDRAQEDEVLHVNSPSSHTLYERERPQQRQLSSSSSSSSSYRRPASGTTMSLRATARKWDKRKEAIEAEIAKAESDIFTQDAADAMRALRGTATPGAYMGRKHGSFLKKRVAATPAATELGRRRRAEQEAALMELGAQITRLRVIRGVDDELAGQEQQPQQQPADKDRVVGHWMHFNASSLSHSMAGDLKTPYKDAHRMISSLAKIASSLASSLAESEIRLQEAEIEARDSRDALLDVSAELEQVRIARDVDAETISRLVSQVPDIALRGHIQQQEEEELSHKAEAAEEEKEALLDFEGEVDIEDDADAIAAVAPFDAATARAFESANLGISGTAMQISPSYDEPNAAEVLEVVEEEAEAEEEEEEPAEPPPAPVAAPQTPLPQYAMDEELTPRTVPRPVAKPMPSRGIFMPSVQFNKNVNTKPLGKLDFSDYMNSAAAWRSRPSQEMSN